MLARTDAPAGGIYWHKGRQVFRLHPLPHPQSRCSTLHNLGPPKITVRGDQRWITHPVEHGAPRKMLASEDALRLPQGDTSGR